MNPFTLVDPPKKFAFLIHPRSDVAADLGTIHPALARIPNRWIESGLQHLPIPPFLHSRIYVGPRQALLGEVILVPLSPRQLLGRDRKLVAKRIDAAIDFAVARGAEIVGLGALISPATGGGMRLRNRHDVGITNGNAFTAVAITELIARAASLLERPTVAVVGATGSVGEITCRLLDEDARIQLELIGRSSSKLDRLQKSLRSGHSTATALAACRNADIVVLLTSSEGAVLGSEHLKTGAIVIDATQPRNTDPALAVSRPDVTVIDGGLVRTPGLYRKGRSIGIPRDVSFGCLAETALLALSGHSGHGTIGSATIGQAAHLKALAGRYANLGFNIAANVSYGQVRSEG